MLKENNKKRIFSRNESQNLNLLKKPKKKREYSEIKLILCQKISSKIYYKLLTLNITPLFNKDTKYFILFDGLYFIHKFSVITINYENNKNSEEKIFAVSDPYLEKIKNIYSIYSIPLDNYIKWQNNLGYILSKELSFKISFKTFNIYNLLPKEKPINKKLGRISSLIKKEIKIEGEEGSENNILNKNNIKVQKSNLLNDNESLASQNTINSKSKGLLAVGKRNKKKDNLNEYKDCNQIKGVVYITILIIIFILIFEYFHIYYLESTIIDFNDSYIKYRKFSKYYFQLFPLTLSLACIQQDINCRSLVSYYSEQYTQNNPDINYDMALFLRMQTERISNKIMDKRTILAKINKLIGEQNYEDNF